LRSMDDKRDPRLSLSISRERRTVPFSLDAGSGPGMTTVRAI
jgi:hypothetical protein